MLSSIGNINKFDSIVKLRAYAGMDPMTRQSGDYNITSHISKRGNPLMRNWYRIITKNKINIVYQRDIITIEGKIMIKYWKLIG